MTKRVTVLLTVFLLLLGLLALPASAQEAGGVLRSAYCQEGSIYAFVSMTDDSASLTVRVNGEPAAGTFQAEAISGQMQYLFVVDTSRFMPQEAEALLCGIAQGLVEQPGQSSRFSVAALGSGYELLAQDLTTIEQVRACVAGISYDQSKADICGGLSSGISSLRSTDRAAGTLVNMIFVTAGSTDGEEAASLLETVIRKSPEVLLHTVSPETWDGAVHAAVSTGRGVRIQAQDGRSGYSAGRRIAQFNAGLKAVTIPWTLPGDTDSVSLELEAAGEYLDALETVPNLDIKPIATAKDLPLEETQETEPVLSGTDLAPGEPAAAEPEGEKGSYLWAAAVGAVLVLAVLVLFCKGKKRGRTVPEGPEGIPMQLEVISGSCKSAGRRFLLRQQLVIGSSAQCDIVWKDPSVSPKHCRILLQDGLIWLEDMNDKSDTAIEGMKIYAPNRLRSEDEITMGNVRFKMLF